MTTITFSMLEVVLFFGWLVTTILYFIEKWDFAKHIERTRIMFGAIASGQAKVRYDKYNKLEFYPVRKE